MRASVPTHHSDPVPKSFEIMQLVNRASPFLLGSGLARGSQKSARKCVIGHARRSAVYAKYHEDDDLQIEIIRAPLTCEKYTVKSYIQIDSLRFV